MGSIEINIYADELYNLLAHKKAELEVDLIGSDTYSSIRNCERHIANFKENLKKYFGQPVDLNFKLIIGEFNDLKTDISKLKNIDRPVYESEVDIWS